MSNSGKYQGRSSTSSTKIKEEKSDSEKSTPSLSSIFAYEPDRSYSTASGSTQDTGQSGGRSEASANGGEKKRKLDDLGSSISSSTGSTTSYGRSNEISYAPPPPGPHPAPITSSTPVSLLGFRLYPSYDPYPSSFTPLGPLSTPSTSSNTSPEKDPVVEITSYYNRKITQLSSEAKQLNIEINSLRTEREKLRDENRTHLDRNSQLERAHNSIKIENRKLVKERDEIKNNMGSLEKEVEFWKSKNSESEAARRNLGWELWTEQKTRIVQKRVLEQERQKSSALEKELRDLKAKISKFTVDVGIKEADGSGIRR